MWIPQNRGCPFDASCPLRPQRRSQRVIQPLSRSPGFGASRKNAPFPRRRALSPAAFGRRKPCRAMSAQIACDRQRHVAARMSSSQPPFQSRARRHNIPHANNLRRLTKRICGKKRIGANVVRNQCSLVSRRQRQRIAILPHCHTFCTWQPYGGWPAPEACQCHEPLAC